MCFATFVVTLLLIFSLEAQGITLNAPLITLPISRRLNFTGPVNFALIGKTRAKALKIKGVTNAAAGAGLPVPFTNAAVIGTTSTNEEVAYIATVGIGSPSTSYQLIVDTGSSNTWVGAGKPYVKTSTSTMTTDKVSVTYGSGSFSGAEFIDQVTISTGLVVRSQSIGVASTSTGFEGVDGILGLGPPCLNFGTLSISNDCCTGTATDNLFSQGTISARLISISSAPAVGSNAANGEIVWGGTDTNKFTGSITFISVTNTSPANEFWGIDTSIRYGASASILSATAGIVDLGTTLVLIATNAFTKYKSATGAILDNNTGLLRITTSQFSALQSLFFTTNSASFELTANAQIWPRALNTDIGGVAGAIYVIVGDLGSNSGEGLDFILGMTFLERFYLVFDTTNSLVGLATTAFTKATTN